MAKRTIKIGDKTYTLSKPKASDLTMVGERYKDSILFAADRRAERITNKEYRDEVREAAEKRVQSFTVYHSKDWEKCCEDPGLMMYFVYCMFHRHHPELSEEDVSDMIESADDSERLIKRIVAVDAETAKKK